MNGVIHLRDVALTFTIKIEKGWYVASCPLLDVHSQATTRDLAESFFSGKE